MRQLFKFLAGALIALSLVMPAMAQSSFDLNQKLTKYDPAAVKAALHYLEIFNMKAAFVQSMPAIREAVIKAVKAKNPGVDDAATKEFVDVVLKVIYVDNAEFFEKFTIIIILDTFTAEEIIEVDKFYSSDIGRSILKKTPQMIARMPEMMMVMQKEIVPLALEEARKALKAKGKNIRT